MFSRFDTITQRDRQTTHGHAVAASSLGKKNLRRSGVQLVRNRFSMKCHGSITSRRHSVCQRGWPQINTVSAAQDHTQLNPRR